MTALCQQGLEEKISHIKKSLSLYTETFDHEEYLFPARFNDRYICKSVL